MTNIIQLDVYKRLNELLRFIKFKINTTKTSKLVYICKDCIVKSCCRQYCNKLSSSQLTITTNFLNGGCCPDCSSNYFKFYKLDFESIIITCYDCNHSFYILCYENINYYTIKINRFKYYEIFSKYDHILVGKKTMKVNFMDIIEEIKIINSTDVGKKK